MNNFTFTFKLQLKYPILILAMYFSTVAYSQLTYTFVYTGAVQTLTLPVGAWGIECWGANGGSITSAGGQSTGGYSYGQYNVITPGTQLNIFVGGVGNPATGITAAAGAGGWNGGGGGAAVGRSGAGGGGASDVRVGGIAAGNRIIVAGGGGGAAYYGSSLFSASVAPGGNGGATLAQNGSIISSAGQITPGGGGSGANGATPGAAAVGTASGTATGGGGGGSSAGSSIGQPGVGGGPGGYAGPSSSGATGSAGGGGGGYAGGAGGVQTVNSGVAGGGGSGYIGGVINGTTTSFGQAGFVTNPTASGNGRIVIRELCSITLIASGNNSLAPSICSGQSLTLTTNAIGNYSWSTGATASSLVISPTSNTVISLTAMSPSNCITSSSISILVYNSVPSLTVSTTGNNICLGQAVALTGSGALTYTWINAGVTQGNAFTPSVTTTYTLLGQNGCGTSTALTTVTVAPLQVAAISSNSIVCASNTASLTCAAAATGFTWQPVGTTGANIVVSPTANTIYTVTASNGTCLGSATVAVNTNPNPTISIAASGSVACQGSAITMTASGGITYTWYPGASNGATYTAMPTAPTLYSVAGTNSFGCTTWANQVVLTNSSPTISISASNTLVCGGTNVTLTASGASSYSWNTGATTAGINDTPQGTTVYTVQGTANGCASSNTIQVSVFNPVLSISGPTSVCRGQTASLTASAADSYTWSNGSPFAGVVVTPTVSTVYSVAALTSTGNLTCPSSASVNVVVNPLPTVTAVASKTSVCRGQSFTLTASGATTYSWNTGATTASLVTSSTLVANINYTVQGTDANGCTNTSVITIKVNSCIGINELNTAQITVYPNPSKGIFELRDITEVMHIEVYTITGQRILSQSSTESTRLDLSQQPKGIYLLKLSQNGTEAAQYKLIRD